MCDRCETKGLLAGLFAKAGVTQPLPAVLSEPAITDPLPIKQSAPRRQKLWEIEEKHHCPVIGSCLTLDELKMIARKSGFNGSLNGSHIEPYRLHVEAVSLSCSRNDAAEAMHKLLERKYALTFARFDRAKTDADVLALWRQHQERGEVAGAMWAVLTHKAASHETRQAVYGDIHMLSHQIGAGQAADLRRLEWLEGRHATLIEENNRQKAEHHRQAEQVVALQRALTLEQAQSAHLEPLLQRVRELESGQAMVALGREEALARLPDLLNASDAVICPTDCVGHLAYYQLKKHCKQNGKPCVLTRSSGVAGFAAALTRLAIGRADIQSQT